MIKVSFATRVLIAFAAFSFCGWGGAVHARQVNALACLKVSEAPTIDGKLDDASWQAAAAATGFSTVQSGGYEPAPRQTTARFVYDEQNLYIAVVCRDSGAKQILSTATVRDGRIFEDDCVELFFGVNAKEKDYVHYAINALGAYYDGRLLDGSWNSQVTVAAEQHADHWIVEAAIPFAALGAKAPQPGEHWAFNIAREHRTRDAEVSFSTWSTLSTSSFHTPRDFSHLRFVDRPVAKPLREMSNIKLGLTPTFGPTSSGPTRTRWEIAGGAQLAPEAYLSDVWVITSASGDMIARQSVNVYPLADVQFKVLLDAKGAGGALFGMILHYETQGGGVSKLPVIWDQPLGGEFARTEKTFRFPPDAHRLLSVELYRSNAKGTVHCRLAGLAMLSDLYDGVKEAADIMADFRMPVGDPAPAIDPVPWSVSRSTGPVSVLCILDNRLQRGTEELAQRFEMDYDLVWQNSGSFYAYGAASVNAKLRRETRPYDVMLVSADIVDKALIGTIKRNVAAGTGLVFLHGPDAPSGADPMSSLLPDMQPVEKHRDHALLRHVPWSYFPTVPNNYIEGRNPAQPAVKTIGVGKIGKGRVVALGYGGPAGTYDGILPHAGRNTTDLKRWWEYAYSLLLKSLAYCCDRPAAARIARVDVNESDNKLRVTIRGAVDFHGTLTQRWTNRPVHDGAKIVTRRVDLMGGRDLTIDIDIPPRVAGMHGLHVANLFLHDEQDKSVDWATATLELSGAVRLSRTFPFDLPMYAAGATIKANIGIACDGPTSQPFTVAAALVDGFGRIVWKETRRIPELSRGVNKIPIAPALDRSIAMWHRLDVTLSGPNGVIDQQQWSINVGGGRDSRIDDFRAGLYGDFYRRTPTDEVFARWIRKMGFDFIVEGGVFEAGPALNIPWHDNGIAVKAFHHHKGGPDNVRNPCLSDPAVIETISNETVAAAGHSLRHGAVLLSMADEPELVKDGMVELCFGPHCANNFRRWAKEQYRDLPALNAQWGTDLRTWRDIEPVTAQQARERGNFAQWVDFRTFMDDVWVGAFNKLKLAIKKQFPDAAVSLGNPFRLNPYSGADHDKLAQAEDFFGKYMRPDLIKEYRSFNPSALMQTHWGYKEDLPFCRWYPWYFAFHGGDVMNFYDCISHRGDYDLFDGTFRHTARSLEVVRAQQDLTRGVGKLLHDALPARNEIAVLYSQNSMKVAWIASDAKVGREIWARRVMDKLPVSHPFALFTKSLDSVKSMIKESWLQPDFVAPAQIADGKLADYRMLILPCSMALSEETLAAVADFVKAGGTVVADLRTAMYDGRGRAMPDRKSFERLFGIKRDGSGYISDQALLACDVAGEMKLTSLAHERLTVTTAKPMGRYPDGAPALTINRIGQGKAIYLNLFAAPGAEAQGLMNQLLHLADIRSRVNLTRPAGHPIGYECFELKRGPIQYVGLLRDMAPQEGKKVMWFGPAFRQALAEQEQIRVSFSAPAHVYDVRKSAYHGRVDELDLAFDRGEAKVLALLPYRVKAIRIDGLRQTYAQGDRVEYQVAVQASAGQPAADHVFRIEAYDPDGILSLCYTRNVLARDGKFQDTLPVALNEKVGSWKVKVTEMASGMAETIEFHVEPAPSS